jgi:hypothetical protein
MPWLTTVTTIGLVVLAALIWLFLRTRSKDRIEEMMAKRRPASRVVSRADFVEGLERIPVALSLTNEVICYENTDIDACLELRYMEEVEYDDETATGQAADGKVLRLRSHGHTFEFVLDSDSGRQWATMLLPRHMDQGTAQAV